MLILAAIIAMLSAAVILLVARSSINYSIEDYANADREACDRLLSLPRIKAGTASQTKKAGDEAKDNHPDQICRDIISAKAARDSADANRHDGKERTIWLVAFAP